MSVPVPPHAALVAALRDARRSGDVTATVRAVTAVARGTHELAAWLSADKALAQVADAGWARRSLRVAVLSSHTGEQLTAALRVAAAVHGLHLTTWTSGYRLFEQEILDPGSELHAFAPEVVVILADQRELHFPELSTAPEDDLAREIDRWQHLWSLLRERTGATVVQATFVPPVDDPLGHLGLGLPGARRRQVRRLNLALAEAVGDGVHLVDAEQVALRAGAGAWFDARYWYLSKNAVGLAAVPLLAEAVADVLGAAVGLARKVIAVDLDNTLWGGVVGEDGVGGLALGDGPAGEAFVDIQRFLRALKDRGLLLAVVSKNNDADARLPFAEHPDMVLTLDDFVAFEATWDDKSAVLRRLADRLGLGLDAFVFVDDNPVERDGVRHQLPQVGVVDLPSEATGYVSALATFPGLATVGLTAEDARRTDQYRSRGRAAELAGAAGSREDFLAQLAMTARVEPLGEANRTRIVQLIGKTNQFNLTGQRPGAAELDAFVAAAGLVWGLRVADRFDDHGLVGVIVANPAATAVTAGGVPGGAREGDLVIDTWVMSCRVLQRTAEFALLAELARAARDRGFTRLVGSWVPSGRNVPARHVFAEAGFSPLGDQALPRDAAAQSAAAESPAPEEGAAATTTWWALDLASARPVDPGFVSVTTLQEAS
ncbi:HAD-IIIC family phosphatase [Propioniciclava soli]|uniref:HAD-IIIC family phosphatase n=1 Tax=Propioniciclava soli TaxID=2775081 RepID=A0ABZ3C449_9ACTN